MSFEEFYTTLTEELKKIGIENNIENSKKLYDYMNILLEWNNRINLTAIKEPKEIILKHFVDSLSIKEYIPQQAKVIDVGTGAGFPGIPNAIYRKDLKVTLLDSLNKRVNFLNEVVEELNLENVTVICSRVEDAGNNKEYREKYDVATSRAVSSLNVLAEYMMPLLKIGGIAICMKGPNYQAEIEDGKGALKKLGGMLEKTIGVSPKGEEISRILVIARKEGKTLDIYPRKPGTPGKNPLKK